MTRQEFMDTLGRALRRELSEQEVQDNLRYYESYIDREVTNGKSEADVLAQLGDPRLIARTILQVDQQKEEAMEQGYSSQETVYTEDADGTFRESYERGDGYGEESSFGGKVKMHSFQVKGWLFLAIVLIVVFVVLGTVFAVVWKLLPLILIAAGLCWLYKRFFS